MKYILRALPALGISLLLPLQAYAQDSGDRGTGSTDTTTYGEVQAATQVEASGTAGEQTDGRTPDEKPATDGTIVFDSNALKTKPKDDGDKKSESKEEKKEDKSWGVSASLGADLGIGAFVSDEHARKVRSRLKFQAGASYTIPVIDTDVYVSTGFSQWLSKAGGSNGKHEFRWSDTDLGFSRNIVTVSTEDKAVNFSLDGDLSFTLPTSKASITTNLYTTISPTISASVKISNLTIAYSITYGHSFHEYTSATVDPDEVDVLSRRYGNEILGSHDIAVGGILNEIELANQLSVGYRFMKELGLSLGFGFADAWTYDTKSNRKDDEFVGKHAKTGRGHSQFSMGTLILNYQPWTFLGFNFGLSSAQPWKTADQKSYRFPWFDSVSPSKNYTKFVIGANFTY